MTAGGFLGSCPENWSVRALVGSAGSGVNWRVLSEAGKHASAVRSVWARSGASAGEALSMRLGRVFRSFLSVRGDNCGHGGQTAFHWSCR